MFARAVCSVTPKVKKLKVNTLKMCSSFEEFVIRDDSDLDEASGSSEDYEIHETHQGNLPSSDSEDMKINNGAVTCGRINKRRRILSTCTEAGDLENSDSNEILSTLSWSKTNFKPMRHAFDNQNSGLKSNLTQASTPLDASQHFFSEQLVSDITEETNNYFTFAKGNTSSKTHSRINSWKPTSTCEMYGFLATVILMPRTKKLTLNEY